MAKRLIKLLSGILFIVTCISFSAAHSAEWVTVNGIITLTDETPLCAMVLANGQHMFTCDPVGRYSLRVPLDDNRQITLFAFCDGLMPFKTVLEEWESDFDIEMSSCKDALSVGDDCFLISYTSSKVYLRCGVIQALSDDGTEVLVEWSNGDIKWKEEYMLYRSYIRAVKRFNSDDWDDHERVNECQ